MLLINWRKLLFFFVIKAQTNLGFLSLGRKNIHFLKLWNLDWVQYWLFFFAICLLYFGQIDIFDLDWNCNMFIFNFWNFQILSQNSSGGKERIGITLTQLRNIREHELFSAFFICFILINIIWVYNLINVICIRDYLWLASDRSVRSGFRLIIDHAIIWFIWFNLDLILLRNRYTDTVFFILLVLSNLCFKIHFSSV